MTKAAEKAATQRRILNTMVTLATTKPLSAITVTEVAQALAINRGTFYLHFADMPAAIAALELALTTKLVAVVQDLPADWLATYSREQELALYTAITQKIASDFKAYQVLLGDNGDPHFMLQLRQALKPYIAPVLARHSKNAAVPSSFLREMIISGLFDILVFWVQQAPQLPVAQVTQILYESRHHSPAQLIRKSLTKAN